MLYNADQRPADVCTVYLYTQLSSDCVDAHAVNIQDPVSKEHFV